MATPSLDHEPQHLVNILGKISAAAGLRKGMVYWLVILGYYRLVLLAI
jgi:hypothetical protein